VLNLVLYEEVLLPVRESQKRHHLGAVILALRTLLEHDMSPSASIHSVILIIEFAHHLYHLLPERQMIAYHKRFCEMYRNGSAPGLIRRYFHT